MAHVKKPRCIALRLSLRLSRDLPAKTVFDIRYLLLAYHSFRCRAACRSLSDRSRHWVGFVRTRPSRIGKASAICNLTNGPVACSP